ncbi:uncharacterized protein LOC124268076 [Haliotis rubra]|uniref:uncharacterized protein LOC124268076 n=1 Tax=Haliotis rubra TaxID=36100 RepID=UPI001EE54BD1|nr:uncharacterized protein LOC124268076 [Haliotis rubra]
MDEFPCYSQFERDFYNFLQRLKREQEDELDELAHAGRLELMREKLDRLIEEAADDASFKYRPDSTGTEISLLEKLQTVSKLRNDPVFQEKTPEPLIEPKVKWHPPPHDSPVGAAAPAAVGVDYSTSSDDDDSEPGFSSQDVNKCAGVDGDVVARKQYKDLSTLENSLVLEDYSDSSDSESEYRLSEDIVALQRDQWNAISDELFKTVEEKRKVSNIDTLFKNKLTIALGGGPDQKMRECKNDNEADHRMSVKDLGQCYIHIGLAEVHRGNADKASVAYQEALTIAREEDSKELLWSALEGLGVVENMKDHKDEAVMYFKTALEILDNEWSTTAVTSVQDRLTARMATLGYGDESDNLTLLGE